MSYSVVLARNCLEQQEQQQRQQHDKQILLKIRNIRNYISFPPKIIKGLSTDGLNNNEDTTIQ